MQQQCAAAATVQQQQPNYMSTIAAASSNSYCFSTCAGLIADQQGATQQQCSRYMLQQTGQTVHCRSRQVALSIAAAAAHLAAQ
jgi:hypothetical protein